MCKAMEDMRKQTLKDGMMDVAKRMLADGTLSLEKIAEYSGLSIEEVEALKDGVIVQSYKKYRKAGERICSYTTDSDACE